MGPAPSGRWSRRLLAATLASTLALPALPTVAQGDYTCQGTAIVGDALSSAAMGLTRGEIDALYGPGNATQVGWLWEFQGFDLIQMNCDLILEIDPGSSFADPAQAASLVRTLLPEDAERTGSWQFGTLQSAPQDAELWVSTELDDRLETLNEPYLGQVLALYTYDGDAYNAGNVIRVELRVAPLPAE
ncbi:MAG: hypothetical protein KC442_05645 [Thermomicrobiales bacterium]|nr:hypothetical protein [Thermomicrobiales bacterium]